MYTRNKIIDRTHRAKPTVTEKYNSKPPITSEPVDAWLTFEDADGRTVRTKVTGVAERFSEPAELFSGDEPQTHYEFKLTSVGEVTRK